ncbi:MAG TPA: hypothetical protein PKD86_06980, partial [Gemmatales bacterium]|nr:hypothetical protein [Gemmatales bacterium]
LVRLAPMVMSTCVVLMMAWLASQWWGRGFGMLSGLALATSFQFTRYAWLAEEDTILCAVITATLVLFARFETVDREENPNRTFFGWRSWSLLAFFVCFGLTNMAKGLIFGPLMAGVPMAAFMLLHFKWRRLQRYLWLWGFVAAAIAAGAWPAFIYWKHPDVLEMWIYDYAGRLYDGYIGEPWWYYFGVWTWALVPWTPVAAYGLFLTFRRALQPNALPERFLLCWGVGTILFFSIPDGKHHHYMIHTLPPWGLITAIGVLKLRDHLAAWMATGSALWRRAAIPALVLGIPGAAAIYLLRHKVPGPDWLPWLFMAGLPAIVAVGAWAWFQPRARLAMGVGFAGLAVLFMTGHVYVGRYVDHGRDDWAFLKEVRRMQPTATPLYVNAELRCCLEVNRVLFALDRSAKAVHNLSFLLDERLQDEKVLVITTAGDAERLQRIGTTRVVKQSAQSRREESPADRLTLFEVALRPDRPRYPNGVTISQQQIKHRKPGPFLGGQNPKDW